MPIRVRVEGEPTFAALARQLQRTVLEAFAREDLPFEKVVEDFAPERSLAGQTPLSVHPALVDTDLVVTVSAAETVLHGGPALLLGAGGPQALRAATAYSLLETGASQGWRLGVELERRLSGRVPMIGASLVLDQPRVFGAARGYPYDPAASERIARSPFRAAFSLLPPPLAPARLPPRRRLARARPNPLPEVP